MDTHKVPFTKQQLQELCASPRDEFGVAHVDVLFNKEANVCFCVLDAPDEEAVKNTMKKPMSSVNGLLKLRLQKHKLCFSNKLTFFTVIPIVK